MDVSKPLKANLSFARLDQINQFLKKIITTNDDVPRKEAAPSAGIIPDEDVTLISRHPSTKDFLPAVHTNAVQKASMQENLWQALSCFQKISVHTVQMVILMETIPHPSKPCLLVSFSNLSGSLNIKSGHKTAGKRLFLKLEVLLVCLSGGLVTISKCGALQGTALANIINPQ